MSRAVTALGALTALRTLSSNASHLVEVDVSVLESLLSTLPYPMLMAEKKRSLGLPATTRSAPMMGIVRAADGWIGINCLTGQHWLDACAMLGLPEYGEHQIAIMLGGPERAEFYEKAQPWLAQRTVAEIVELGQAMRIPVSPVNDGATVVDCPQYRDREFSWTQVATTGRSASRGLRSGCRGHPCCRHTPRLASVRKQPPKRLRDHVIGAPAARAQLQRCPSQASRFLT
jgi:crotonobetainyl-CoA:carnitine CoA-transferase CaiB-like acyl-CoA transferase